MEKKIKAVIFDLDGTLLYTLEDLKNSLNYALKKYSYPERSLSDVRKFIGNGVARLVELSLPDGKDDRNYEKVLELFKSDYSLHCEDNTVPYDGIPELLDALSERGISIGVVSNKYDSAVKKLCLKYFGDKVNSAVGECENIRRKPFPDSTFKALEALGCKADEALYVGDSEVDIATAANAGMECVSVTWGYRDEDVLWTAGAKIIISKPSGLLQFV